MIGCLINKDNLRVNDMITFQRVLERSKGAQLSRSIKEFRGRVFGRNELGNFNMGTGTRWSNDQLNLAVNVPLTPTKLSLRLFVGKL